MPSEPEIDDDGHLLKMETTNRGQKYTEPPLFLKSDSDLDEYSTPNRSPSPTQNDPINLSGLFVDERLDSNPPEVKSLEDIVDEGTERSTNVLQTSYHEFEVLKLVDPPNSTMNPLLLSPKLAITNSSEVPAGERILDNVNEDDENTGNGSKDHLEGAIQHENAEIEEHEGLNDPKEVENDQLINDEDSREDITTQEPSMDDKSTQIVQIEDNLVETLEETSEETRKELPKPVEEARQEPQDHTETTNTPTNGKMSTQNDENDETVVETIQKLTDTTNTPSHNTPKATEINAEEPKNVEEPNSDLPRSRKRKLQKVDDPNGFKMTRQRKKVPRKVVDNVWEVPSNEDMNDIGKIINMCINQAIQKYGTRSKPTEPSKKMIEAQKILVEAWGSSTNQRSFLARLSATNIPVVSRTDIIGVQNGVEGDMLSIDRLLRRKKVIEAHLLADIKQLNELKRNVNNLETVYQLDKKYLQELRKSSQKIGERMNRQSVEIRIRNGVGLGGERFDKSIRLRKQESLAKTFDPNTDSDTRMMLMTLMQLLQRLKSQSEPMEGLNGRLEGLIRKLT